MRRLFSSPSQYNLNSSLNTAAILTLALALALPATAADNPFAPDVPEVGSVEAIAAATTEDRFLSQWVAYVPESDSVPSPTDYLGHIVGEPGELTDTTAIYGYLRKLAEASPRVRVETIGTTEEGRDIVLAIVSDEEASGDLGKYREATARLADPRGCDEACLEATLEWAKPIYYLNGALHSTETGSAEMLMELAYRLAVSDTPEIQAIREKVIVLINPVCEPDGRDRAVEWFHRYLKGKTDYDNLPYSTPPYWGSYVFHDNNRDTHQRRLALTRAAEGMFLDWHPQVMHDLHESIPLLQIWTGTGPYNVNMSPILVGAWHEMAFHEVRALSSLGMPGVWTWGFGEGWSHVYLDSIALNHNAFSRGYETFGITSSEIMDVRLNLRYESYVGKPVTRREWYRPWPPPRTFKWSLRNNINYQQTGVLAILQYTSMHGTEMLTDFWRMAKNAVDRGAGEPPFAFVIPEKQRDLVRLTELVNNLRGHGIEVSRARQDFEAAEKKYPAGSYVVRLDQPYSPYAMDLLEPQKFPADAEHKPYDDVSWSLPVQFGVDVVRVDEKTVLGVPVDLLTSDVSYSGTVTGDGPVFLLADTGQSALLAARHRLAGAEIEVAEKAFSHDGADYPAGSWIIKDGAGETLREVSAELALDFRSAARAPDVPSHSLDLPRMAVMATWDDTESAGWLRLQLDRDKVPFTYIKDDEIKAGGLERDFDVIVYPNTYASLKSVVQGIDPSHGPMPYTKTAEFPTHGSPKSSPDITGGLGYRGVANLFDFVEKGGVLVTLGGATGVAIDGGFVRDIRHARTKSLYTSGVEIRTSFPRPEHPAAYGYPEVTSVHRGRFPLYETREADIGRIVMQWGTKPPRFDDPKGGKDGPWGVDSEVEEPKDEAKDKDGSKSLPMVVSGGMKGEAEIQGKPAILDVPVGDGRVVAFNFDPIHRTLTLSDHRLLWNIILNWNDLPPVPPNPANLGE